MLRFVTIQDIEGVPVRFYQDIDTGEFLIHGDDLRKALEATPEKWAEAQERANLTEGIHYREIKEFDIVNLN